MILKSLHADPERTQRLWKLARKFVPRHLGWFYEGCPDVPGQMWYAERKVLYETIRRCKPMVICESGTWMGGGSTYFIAQALKENGQGVLHTTEAKSEFFEAAVRNYEQHLSKLRPFVEFHLGESLALYPDILRSLGKVDAVLLDGAEDGQQTFEEFRMFEPYLGSGAILMAHDWNTEKMVVLRPYLEHSDSWKLRQMVPPPQSVGFVVFQYQP